MGVLWSREEVRIHSAQEILTQQHIKNALSGIKKNFHKIGWRPEIANQIAQEKNSHARKLKRIINEKNNLRQLAMRRIS